MNWLLVPSLVLAGFLFVIGAIMGGQVSGVKEFFLFAFAFIIGAPGLISATYYLNIFNELIWLSRFYSLNRAVRVV